MPLTRDFKETIKARTDRDPAFRRALVEEASDCLLNNDFETAKALIRDYINATIGFEALAHDIGAPTKSLMRMFGPRGNPQARSFLPVVAFIRQREMVACRQAPAGDHSASPVQLGPWAATIPAQGTSR